MISRNKCIHSFLLNFRSPTPTFTTAVDNFTKQQFNYTLELRSTIESTIESYMDQNYTLYSVYWSQMAMSHNRILFRINIWTYSFLLKLVPSIILTVITGFLIKGTGPSNLQSHSKSKHNSIGSYQFKTMRNQFVVFYFKHFTKQKKDQQGLKKEQQQNLPKDIPASQGIDSQLQTDLL